ncbi:MAG: cytochrome P450 [Pseudomonadota bacterium]
MSDNALREAEHLHLFEEEYRRDPYAFYANIRQKYPVAWDKALNAWVVTRAEDVETVFKDARTFSSDRVDIARARFTDPNLKSLIDTLGHLMLQRDDPDHRRIRKLVHTAFVRTEVERYRDWIADLCRELLAPAAKSGRLEFVKEFAVPLPILVISKIIGIPREDRAKIKSWCDAFSFVALNFYAKISPEKLAEGAAAVEDFRSYLKARLAAARRSEDRCLLNTLAQAEADGDRFTLDELIANILFLINAGNETTRVLLSNGMHDLLINPDAMARLRADPTAIPAAVEEMLRFEAPVQFLGRVATCDTNLAGNAVKRGDLVLVFLGSADRDEARFDHPDEFDISRQLNRHQAFGNGPHLCAGIQLARLEARIAFQVLLDVFSDIALAPGELRYGQNMNLRGLTELPLLVTGRA